MSTLDNLKQIRKLYELKQTYRASSTGNRKESTAEHTWSALILADYFMNKFDLKLNKLKVFQLILYHDLHELISGDYELHPDLKHEGKEKQEYEAIQKIANIIPGKESNHYLTIINEYETRTGREAIFAKVIDGFDADLQTMRYKKDWKGWTRKFTEEKRHPYLKKFPELLEAHTELLNYLEAEGFFDQ